MDDPVSPYISSWPGNSASESYSFLDDPVESYGGDESMQHSNYVSRAASNHHLKYSEHENNSTMFARECLLYSVQTGLLSGEIISKNKLPNNLPQLQQLHNNSDQQSNFMVPGALDYNSTDGSFHPQLDVPHRAELPHALSSSIDSNGGEISAFLADAHAISSTTTMCSTLPRVSSYMEPIKLQYFGFQDAHNVAVARETSAQVANLSQLDNATLTSLNHHNEFLNGGLSCFTTGQHTQLANGGSKTQQQEQNVMRNHHVTTFIAGTQMPFGDAQGAVIPPKSVFANVQIPWWIHENNDEYPISHSSDAQPQANSANGNGGSVRPRVRARRGQATDPHSIAERLRREEISDRMKNLQDLVPSSKKVDKASMLDEIIEYVKFLQLQVKVLSMSRLGATGAVLPLLAESQTEPASISSNLVQGLLDIPDSEDGYAFEQEVKLMETSITSAMQYLQNKGLCLMPVALASAISSLKGTAAAATPPDRRNASAGPNLHEETMQEEGTKACSNAVVSMNCASELKPRA